MYNQHHHVDSGSIEMGKVMKTSSSIEGNTESIGGGNPGRDVNEAEPKVGNEEICSFDVEDSSKEADEVGKQHGDPQQPLLLNSEKDDVVSAGITSSLCQVLSNIATLSYTMRG